MTQVTNAVATGKKRANAVVTVATAGDVMTFTVDGFGPLALDVTKMHPDLITRAVFHGMKQRVSDAAAIPCAAATGRPARPAEKHAAMAALVDHYNSGTAEWNIKRAAGGGRDTTAIVVQALANIKKTTIESITKQVGELAAKSGVEFKDIVKQMAGSADVIREVAAIRAARVGVDADDLLDELK